jgi:acyl carrier protein
MRLEEKLALLAETLEADPSSVKADTELKSLDEWDSMGKLSVMAMFSSKFGKEITGGRLTEYKVVADILSDMD